MKKGRVYSSRSVAQLQTFMVNIGMLKKGMIIDEMAWGTLGRVPPEKGKREVLMIGIEENNK